MVRSCTCNFITARPQRPGIIRRDSNSNHVQFAALTNYKRKTYIEAKTDWEKNDRWPLDVTECTRSVDPIRWHLKVPSIAEKIHIISSDTRHWFKRYVDLFLCMRFFMMNGLCARRDMTLYAFRCPRFHRIARLITRIIVKVLLTLTQIELNIGNVNIESSDQSIQNPIHHKIPGIDWKRGNDFRTNPSLIFVFAFFECLKFFYKYIIFLRIERPLSELKLDMLHFMNVLIERNICVLSSSLC